MLPHTQIGSHQLEMQEKESNLGVFIHLKMYILDVQDVYIQMQSLDVAVRVFPKGEVLLHKGH